MPKKHIFLLLYAFLALIALAKPAPAFISPPAKEGWPWAGVVTAATDSVYICTGPNSTTYHTKPTCKGLQSHFAYKHLKKVSLTDAIAMGRRPCKMCHHKN